MAFLSHKQPKPSVKRQSSFKSPIPSQKIPKLVDSEIERMVSILADAGCTLMNSSGPPCLPSHPNKFRDHLTRLFSHDPTLRSQFLAGFSSYIQSPTNLTRLLKSSLVRNLLLVPCIQLELQEMLLEKVPEYFHVNGEESLSLEDDVARLIINQFRWLDFLVDAKAFTDKLVQVLFICPLHLKKEIIGSLPEIIGDQKNNETLVDSLQQLLKEDVSLIVPVLDSFSNLDLNLELHEQAITIALSCIRTIDADDMPYLLRFLLLSATPDTIRRIISHIRQHLKFVGSLNSHAVQQNKLKGKSILGNAEASILDALRSSLRFKNMLCQEILKELNSLERPRDHKVIDIWFIILMYMKGDPLQRNIAKTFKKKITEDCFTKDMLDQCIRGNKELIQDYFPSFLSLSECLLECKEQKAGELGIHMYTILFEEFADSYLRQEILGALITHVGSGINFEVHYALETLSVLASKCPGELIPLSSYINGILDYLEGFSVANLHKVYEVFSQLVVSAQSSTRQFGSSIVNELLMVVKKQVNHPELKYKMMGLVGALKIVSCLGDASNAPCEYESRRSNAEEASELLKTSFNSCKQLSFLLILFHDELAAILSSRTLRPEILEWIGTHVGEFESVFLLDLEGGQLPKKDYHSGLEGELWMNLDGDISPICLNILPLASSLQFASLQSLPANFHLLSAVERLTNQGSLRGIDALLGCPLHLPSSKYFSVAGWQTLTAEQKKIVTLSLYHAANWIRELLNAFCTQVSGSLECISQATKEEIVAKLFKRLRNLVFIESLLNFSIKCCLQSLPELHIHVEDRESSLFNQSTRMGHGEKNNEQKKIPHSASQDCKRKRKNISKTSNSEPNGKLRQPTIIDVLRKSGNLASQEVQDKDSPSTLSKEKTSKSADKISCDSDIPLIIEVSVVAKGLESQRYKFRPLLFQCFSTLTNSKKQYSCCSDPAAELPLYLYLLRDLHYKLDHVIPPRRQFFHRSLTAPAGFTRMTSEEFICYLRSVFPTLRRHFDVAVCVLKEADDNCLDHWKIQSGLASNPDIDNLQLSKSSVSTLVIKETLTLFSKMLKLPDQKMDESLLSGLLESFQTIRILDSVVSGIQPTPLPGTTEYLYVGVFSFLEDVLDIACSFSFILASECLLTLESVVISLQKFHNKLEGNNRSSQLGTIQGALQFLHARLGTFALKLLKTRWENESHENGWKNKGDIIQKILWIYLNYSESTLNLLDELACFILPQVTLNSMVVEDVNHGFETLCSATFSAWYRVLHEVNPSVLNKLVKEAVHLEKCKASIPHATVDTLLSKIHQCVKVVVSLINMCKIHEKVNVHAVAVKQGGKFVDSFLKVFDFLQAQFQTHDTIIIELVKDLQKATRTIQTLCSEAKGLKQTVITSKIPATKRSMERFLFHVKALFHAGSIGCSFWMGNLKHKDLTGQVVSSQVYIDDEPDNVDDHQIDEDPPVSPACEEDLGTE